MCWWSILGLHIISILAIRTGLLVIGSLTISPALSRLITSLPLHGLWYIISLLSIQISNPSRSSSTYCVLMSSSSNMIHPSRFSSAICLHFLADNDMIIPCPEPTLKPSIRQNERTDKDDAADDFIWFSIESFVGVGKKPTHIMLTRDGFVVLVL